MPPQTRNWKAPFSRGNSAKTFYYRLNIIRIQITPLRERPEDIPPLIEFYLKHYASRFNQAYDLKPDAQMVKKLMAYNWPGNVRELQNVLKRMLVLGNWQDVVQELTLRQANGLQATAAGPSRDTLVSPGQYLAEFYAANGNPALAEGFSLKEVKKRAVEKIESEVISYVLKQTGWNRSKAAKILKISYKTLLYKISELGITPPPNGNEAG